MDVLIADDEPMDLELMTAYLVRWGYQVTPCADGEQAWATLAQRSSPSLVVLDWMMPGLDGLEVCRRVRATPRLESTYILLVTGRSRRDDLVQGLAAGADDYVVKPFDHTELQARVQVGARMIALTERLLEAERCRVLAEAAGGAAHEIAQPLSVILGLSQLLERSTGLTEAQHQKLARINQSVRRIEAVLQRMAQVQGYAARPYLDGATITDFGGGLPDQGPVTAG